MPTNAPRLNGSRVSPAWIAPTSRARSARRSVSASANPASAPWNVAWVTSPAEKPRSANRRIGSNAEPVRRSSPTLTGRTKAASSPTSRGSHRPDPRRPVLLATFDPGRRRCASRPRAGQQQAERVEPERVLRPGVGNPAARRSTTSTMPDRQVDQEDAAPPDPERVALTSQPPSTGPITADEPADSRRSRRASARARAVSTAPAATTGSAAPSSPRRRPARRGPHQQDAARRRGRPAPSPR